MDTESTVCFRRCSTGRTAPVQKDTHLIADGGILQCGEVGTRTCVEPCRVADSTTADTASDVEEQLGNVHVGDLHNNDGSSVSG